MTSAQGSYFYWGEQRLGQGRDNVSALLTSDAALMQRLTGEVRAAIQAAATEDGMMAAAASSAGEESEEESDHDSEPKQTTA